jgi:hypothetical protein
VPRQAVLAASESAEWAQEEAVGLVASSYEAVSLPYSVRHACAAQFSGRSNLVAAGACPWLRQTLQVACPLWTVAPLSIGFHLVVG